LGFCVSRVECFPIEAQPVGRVISTQLINEETTTFFAGAGLVLRVHPDTIRFTAPDDAATPRKLTELVRFARDNADEYPFVPDLRELLAITDPSDYCEVVLGATEFGQIALAGLFAVFRDGTPLDATFLPDVQRSSQRLGLPLIRIDA
jgi:hypothetical protein